MTVTSELIGSVSLADVKNASRPCRPREKHEVGQTYWCAYWRYTYTVEKIEGFTVFIRMSDGTKHSHMTALDWRRDRVITA